METLLIVMGIITVAAITPGPNNFIVMGAATQAGFTKTLSLIAGILLGGLILIGMVWAGAAPLLTKIPMLKNAITAAGALYLIWLGWSIIRQPIHSKEADQQPQKTALPHSFTGIVIFQFLNPKAWVLVTTALTALSQDLTGMWVFLTLLLIYACICGTSLSLWALLGTVLSRWLKQEHIQRKFNWGMGSLLIAPSLYLLITRFGSMDLSGNM